MEELEVAAEERDPAIRAEGDPSRVEEEEEGAQSTAGSAYNPENPYHVSSDFSNIKASKRVNFWLTVKRHLRKALQQTLK